MKVFVSYVITTTGGMHAHHDYGDRVIPIDGPLNAHAVEQLRKSIADSSFTVRDHGGQVALTCICPLRD